MKCYLSGLVLNPPEVEDMHPCNNSKNGRGERGPKRERDGMLPQGPVEDIHAPCKT